MQLSNGRTRQIRCFTSAEKVAHAQTVSRILPAVIPNLIAKANRCQFFGRRGQRCEHSGCGRDVLTMISAIKRRTRSKINQAIPVMMIRASKTSIARRTRRIALVIVPMAAQGNDLHCLGGGQREVLSRPAGVGYFAFTLEVIEPITVDAILNWSLRFVMPWRRAIQSKSV